MPEVSVVIPLFNKAPYVERAIKSVLGQTVHGFELIVVDDGSTDGGADMVVRLSDARIRLIRQSNSGVSAARNRGITEAEAELIAFLDADDEWKPWFLETILHLRKIYPHAGMYATAYDISEKSGKTRKSKPAAIPPGDEDMILANYFASAARGELPFHSSAIAIPKYVFREVGDFPVSEFYGEDQDLWCRIVLRFPVAFTRRMAAVYHMEANTSNDVFLTDELRFMKTLRSAMSRGEIPDHLLTDAKEYIARAQLELIRNNTLMGNKDVARKLLAECDTVLFYGQKLRCFFWLLMPTGLRRIFVELKKKLMVNRDG